MTDEPCSPATMRDLKWLESLMRAEVEALRNETKIYNDQVDKALGVADQINNSRSLARMWALGIVVTVLSIGVSVAMHGLRP